MNSPDPLTIGLIGTRINVLLQREIESLFNEARGSGLRITRTKALMELEVPQVVDFVSRSHFNLILLFFPPGHSEVLPVLATLRNAIPRCPLIAILSETPLTPFDGPFREGISDFIVPPVRSRDLLQRIERHLSFEETTGPAPRIDDAGFAGILGQSPLFKAELDKIQHLRGCSITALISGETGSGKELFARAIHRLSPRSAGPFVAVNCGAIPAELFENEFFGHSRGAFTGAATDRVGLLRESDHGSLLLDEIDSLPLPMQAKLLRFLQEKEYRPLGATKPVHSDVRVIAASNASLEEAVRLGRFRSDLYYRINVISFNLPPLRERFEDIPLLAAHFLKKYAAEHDRPARKFSPEADYKLLSYRWPGNVREMENVIHRAVLVSPGEFIEAEQLEIGTSATQALDGSFGARKAEVVREFEIKYLTQALRSHGGNISAAARSAQKSRRAFWQLLRKHRLVVRPPHTMASNQRKFQAEKTS